MMIICSFMIFESLDQVGAFNGLTRTIENCVDKANEALSSPTMDIDGKEIVPDSMTLTVRNVVFSYDTKKIIDDMSAFFSRLYFNIISLLFRNVNVFGYNKCLTYWTESVIIIKLAVANM